MSKRHGFTLVELVVVVMILEILAAVAVPQLLSTSSTATDNGLRQTLSIIRDAIDRYAAENQGSPPRTDSEDNFRADVKLYLRAGFPACPVGAKNNQIAFVAAGSGTFEGEDSPDKGWKVNSDTGEIIINYNAQLKSETGVNYDDL